LTAHAKDIFHDSVQPASLRGKIRDARFVVTVSDFNRAYLAELMEGERADIRRLYNGIDLQRFRPAKAPRAANLILSVGRLVEKKGFDVLIEACALLAARGVAFQCEIIGKGEHQAKLQKLIDARGLHTQVRLVGPKPQDEVRKAYQQATIFALPCIIGQDGNRDGLPTVLLEAMATGLPVVSTALTGIPEIIDDRENGLVVPPNDAESLAQALATLLENSALRERMGQAGRRKVEACFDVRKSVNTLRRWFMEPYVPNPKALAELPSPDLPEELVFSTPLSIQQVFAIL
ncbi:MAG TPA: glycosyltransferase family 4 protein, partial [Anaerolineales bacterium]|nr:glycosyltransferase family 4 protein [Anaerolineales bacterium]